MDVSDALIEWNIIILIIYLTVPVITETITPAGDNTVAVNTEGETQTFTCTTVVYWRT